MVDEPAPRDLWLDVTDRVGEPARIAATYFPPTTEPVRPATLVCLPGGTYTRRYFDLEVPGLPDYSFARDAAGRGFPVGTFDMLGTGASTRPDRDIDFAAQASAMAGAVAQLPQALGLEGPFVGIGHSMGGYVAMLQQAADRSYAALAILGTTNQHVAPLGLPPDFTAAAGTPEGRNALVEQTAAAMPERFVDAERTPMLAWFHLDDVPPVVVEADTASTLTVVPRRCAAASMVPGVATGAAATIDVPVFLAYGDVDVSPEPRAEPGFFPTCHDITLFLLHDSGHCHNMAGTRHELWQRLTRWVAEVIT